MDVIFQVAAILGLLAATGAAASRAQREVEVQLPSAADTGAAAGIGAPVVLVEYDGRGRLRVDGADARDPQGAEAALRERLANAPDAIVRLCGDRGASHELTAQLLVAARRARAERVEIAVEQAAARSDPARP